MLDANTTQCNTLLLAPAVTSVLSHVCFIDGDVTQTDQDIGVTQPSTEMKQFNGHVPRPFQCRVFICSIDSDY